MWVGLSRQGAPQRFVGRRAEIWQVHDGLAAGSVMLAPTTGGTSPGDGTTTLRGLGGVGKSLLAEEYARRFAAAWPGGIFWLRAGGGKAADAEGRLFEQRQVLASKLGIALDNLDPDALERALAATMAARPGPYLWVVDDLPHGLTSRQAKEWFAPSNQGRTLVTTRDRGLDGIARQVDVAELLPEEALRLLTLNRPPENEAEQQAADEIVELLGCHALAVDLARHLVERRGYDRLVTALRDPGQEALELAARMRLELPNDHDKSIAETLLQSIRLLTPQGLDALRLAAVLAPHEPIPDVLLAAVMGQEMDEDSAFLAVDDAQSHSLCEAKNDSYTVHALVCRTVALRYADERGAMVKAAAVEMLRRVMSDAADDIRSHGQIAALVPHARSIAGAPEIMEEADLIGWVGRYFYEAGLYAAAGAAYSTQLAACERLIGLEHPYTLDSLNNFASTLKAQGDLAGALRLEEAALPARRRLLGPEHPDVLTGLNNLAGTLFALGDIARACQLMEEALAERRRLLGTEHPDTLTTLNDLAATLSAQGDLAGARLLHEEALEVRCRLLGTNHPQTLTSLHNLAATLYAQGDLVGARLLLEEALAARRRVHGPEHPDTLTALNNLAATLSAQGDLAGARLLQEEALEARRRLLGPEHPATLASLNNLAGTLSAQGDLAGARLLQEETLGARRRLLGPEHPDTLTGLNNLAATLYAQGDLVGARRLQEEVLDARRRLVGLEHPDTLIDLNNLGATLRAQGDLAGARLLQEQALDARRQLLGPEDPDTCNTAAMLAFTLILQGETDVALPLLEQAAAGLTKALGADHPDTRMTVDILNSLRTPAPVPG